MGWLILIIILLLFLGVAFFIGFRTRSSRNLNPPPYNPYMAPRQEWDDPTSTVMAPPMQQQQQMMAPQQQQMWGSPYTQNPSTLPTMPASPPFSLPVSPLPPVNTPPPTFLPGEVSTPQIIVKRRRPGTDPASTGYTVPRNLQDPIRRPDTVPVAHNQKECGVCHQSIDWSSSSTGWARCLQTNRLVHGHCYASMKQDKEEQNWCAICGGSCQSNQAMRIEGKTS